MAINVTPQLIAWMKANDPGCPRVHPDASDETKQTSYGLRCAHLLVDETLSGDKYLSLTSEDNSMVTADKMFSGGSGLPNVKGPAARYNTKQYVGKHARTGEPILNERGEETLLPSQVHYAKTGALIKSLAFKSGLQAARPTEHEAELLAQMAAEDEWAGDLNGEYCRSIRDVRSGNLKALLDDSVSGGLEITPIHFDDDVISTPQLHGELWPFVQKKEIARGRRVEGASIQNISVTSGEGEDNSQMNLFDTASLVAALDSSIFTSGVAITLGRSFLSDSAVDVGQLVTHEISQSFLAWLDEQVAIGDGTTEPEGILVASGTTSVAWGGAVSIDNYESMLFAVPKAQRPKNNPSIRFCSTETTYQRARAIAISGTDDRRIFGMTHEDFMLLDRPYAISTALGNTQVFFGDLSKWRGYRRVGMNIEVHTQGSTLARSNLALITARMRIGGRAMLPSSFAVSTSAPA